MDCSLVERITANVDDMVPYIAGTQGEIFALVTAYEEREGGVSDTFCASDAP